MKITRILFISIMLIAATVFSYAVPETMYTNFARTAGGALVLHSTVDVRITIFDGAVMQYQEEFVNIATNGYGLFTVKLGTGTPIGPDTWDGLVAKPSLNVQAETDDGGGYRFIQLSPLVQTALKNKEAASIVTLNDAYLNGDTIDVQPSEPITLTGTGLIQSDVSIAAINANGDKTLTTKEYVDDAISAIFPLPAITEGYGIEILPGHQWDGTSTQSVGIRDTSITNVKINNATELLAVEALGTGATAGTDTGVLSIKNDDRNLKFRGVGNTKVTRNANTILIDGADNWGTQSVVATAPLYGNGTSADPLHIKFDDFTNSLIPKTDSSIDLGSATHRWRNIYATKYFGGFQQGAILFGNADGSITEDPANLLYDESMNMLVLDGSMIIGGSLDSNPELYINGGEGIKLDAGATLEIGDAPTNYAFPTQVGPAKTFLFHNTQKDLDWYSFGDGFVYDTTNKEIFVNFDTALTFTKLITFNPDSGSGIIARSSDPLHPTVRIEHMHPLGVALELTGQEPQTTALEVTTGGINIANGHFIVSSNAGNGGITASSNGPSITVQNEGFTEGALTENGGAIDIRKGHTNLSYIKLTSNTADLSNQPYSVIEIAATSAYSISNLPVADFGIKPGSLLIIINSSAFVITLPNSLGTVPANSAVQLVFNGTNWYKI